MRAWLQYPVRTIGHCGLDPQPPRNWLGFYSCTDFCCVCTRIAFVLEIAGQARNDGEAFAQCVGKAQHAHAKCRVSSPKILSRFNPFVCRSKGICRANLKRGRKSAAPCTAYLWRLRFRAGEGVMRGHRAHKKTGAEAPVV